MKNEIIYAINLCVDKGNNDSKVSSLWREPIIGFASANDPMFLKLKDVIGDKHSLPQDIVSGAKSVIAYFIPFEKSVVESNKDGFESSKMWNTINIDTDLLLKGINESLIRLFRSYGHEASLISATGNYDETDLTSNWSHRHVAYIAGVGTFGINNMLITEKGSCGRIGTVVTTKELEATKRSRVHITDKSHDKTYFYNMQ